MSETSASALDARAVVAEIHRLGAALGFQKLGISGIDLADDERRLDDWLAAGCAGTMDYMHRHGSKRARPAELVPGTLSVISARIDYLPDAASMQDTLAAPERAYVSRYALGRDYHKLLRNRLQKLADRLADRIGPFGHRVFTDSAPVLEKALARNAGLGWIGKHTNLIDARTGSWFFLGEIYTTLALPADPPAANHCGTCTRCLAACPTGAIVAPYRVDARRCLSYLTIELDGPIPHEFRRALGNRIYGCDDCQLVCPWNKFAQRTAEPDFAPRHRLDQATLVELFAWDEETFLRNTEGSAIRRIGHPKWLSNIAIALGNAAPTPAATAALTARSAHPSALVRDAVSWALSEFAARAPECGAASPSRDGV